MNMVARSSRSSRSRPSPIVTFEARIDTKTDAKSLYRAGIFVERSTDNPVSRQQERGKLRMAARAVSKSFGALNAWRRKYFGQLSIRSIIKGRQQSGLQPTADGFETVALPFSQLLLIAGSDDSDFLSELERSVRTGLTNDWANYVDADSGFGTRAICDKRLLPDALHLYFGLGVFAPDRSSDPIGEIVVRNTSSNIVAGAFLPDGAPAGLYKWQSQISIGPNHSSAPAQCGALDELAVGLTIGPSIDTVSRNIIGLNVWRDDATASADETVQQIWPVADGDFEPELTAGRRDCDAIFRVVLRDQRECEIDVRLDRRASRLLRSRPTGMPALTIVGVLEPRRNGLAPLRWWIDLDNADRICGSALAQPRRSLVCDGDLLEVWDWRNPAARKAYSGRLANIETSDGLLRVLLADAASPFGWIAAPQRSTPVSFADDSRAVYSFDWLDFAGAVEEATGQYRRRLGGWLAEYGENRTLPGLEGGDAASSVMFCARGEQTFARNWNGEWTPRSRFICGNLLLETTA